MGVLRKQVGECDAAKATAGMGEEGASVHSMKRNSLLLIRMRQREGRPCCWA